MGTANFPAERILGIVGASFLVWCASPFAKDG